MSESIKGLLKQLATALATEGIGVDEAVAMLQDTGEKSAEPVKPGDVITAGHPEIADGTPVTVTQSGRF